MRAVGLQRPDEDAAPRCEGDAVPDEIVHHADRQIAQQGDTLAQGRLEGDLTAHGPLGDSGDAVLQADRVGELVDAFLFDHGGIHVGQEQALAAVGAGDLHGDVERFGGEGRP